MFALVIVFYLSLLSASSCEPTSTGPTIEGRKALEWYIKLHWCIIKAPVIQLYGISVQCPVESPPTTNPTSSTTPNPTTITTTTKPIITSTTTTKSTTTTTPPDNCEKYSGICACLQNQECEFSNGVCKSNYNVCSNFKVSPMECVRPGHFYIYDGVVCVPNSVSSPENCIIAKTLLAINLGGSQEEDSKGVIHDADQGSYAVFGGEISRYTQPATSDQVEDVKIYSSYVELSSKAGVRVPCFDYYLPVEDDGFYALTLKIAEPAYTARGNRTFHFDVNGIHPYFHVDPVKYTGKRYLGKEFVVNMMVVEYATTLVLKGSNMITSRINNNEIRVRFCNSLCGGNDLRLALSGFSFVKYDPSTPFAKSLKF